MTFLPIHPDSDLGWSSLRDAIAPFIGERVATLFSYAISVENGCPASVLYFGGMLVAAGDDPDKPQVTETEQLLIDWGRLIVRAPHEIPEEFYSRLETAFGPERRLALLTFASQVIAINLINTVGRVAVDDGQAA